MSRTNSTLAATLLTLVLAVPGLAGNIGSPGGSPPPPPPIPEANVGSPGLLAPGELGLEFRLIDILLAVLSLT